MKTKITLALIFINLSLLYAQESTESKFRTYFDAGVFRSNFAPANNGGSYVAGGFGYKINDAFWLNITVAKISATGTFESNPVFLNNQTNYNNTLVVPNFSKSWKVAPKLSLSGAIGGALLFEKTLVPSVTFDSANNFSGIDFTNEGEEFSVALFAEFMVQYEVIKNLLLTFSTKSYVPMYLEPDSIMYGLGAEIRL